MDFKSFDFKKLEKYFGKHSADDFNRFLEKLPHHAGHNVLIAAGIVWALAAGIGLYASIQAQEMITVRAELKETRALKPAVPKIKNVAISKQEVEAFAKKAQESYRGLNIRTKGSTIIITSASTRNFTEFREAVGHIQNGGDGWRVTLEKLCVGRECDKSTKLAITLNVNRVSVEKPS